MRQIFFCGPAIVAGSLVSCGQRSMNLAGRLETLPGATVTRIENDTLFREAYEINIFQPIDHNNPDGPGFTQQLFSKPGQWLDVVPMDI